MRLKAAKAAGGDIPGMANISKLSMSDIVRLQRDLGLRIVGAGGHAPRLHRRAAGRRSTPPPATRSSRMITGTALYAQAPPIYGGTDQIQRNIIGERALGLPKEPGNRLDRPVLVAAEERADVGRKAGVSPEETKADLLRAAATVFARSGYEGASIAEITAEAGTSSGPIYLHYGGKAELFVAMLRAHTDAELDAVLGRLDHHDVTSLLASLGSELARAPDDRGALMIEAIVAARRDPKRAASWPRPSPSGSACSPNSSNVVRRAARSTSGSHPTPWRGSR